MSPSARITSASGQVRPSARAGGLAVAGVGFLLLPVAPNPLSYPTLAIGLALLGAGAGSLAIASAIIMSGTPPEKAGNAAAIEETAYDLGTVLGVAVLGSLASVFYRAQLEVGLGEADVGGVDAGPAGEPLAAVLELSSESGVPEVGAAGEGAFGESLATVSLVGGVTLLAVPVVACLQVPRSLDLTRQRH